MVDDMAYALIPDWFLVTGSTLALLILTSCAVELILIMEGRDMRSLSRPLTRDEQDQLEDDMWYRNAIFIARSFLLLTFAGIFVLRAMGYA